MKVSFNLNNNTLSIQTPPLRRLSDILSEDFQIQSIRRGCRSGHCGSCLVFFNDRLVNSCLIPAFRIDHQAIVTLEGIKNDKLFEILEKAFDKFNAFSCEFCKPGVLMAAYDLLSHTYFPVTKEIKEALTGNVCFCGEYRVFITIIKYALKVRKKL
jgi:carbon-monoxide dehydrogenase small subunit